MFHPLTLSKDEVQKMVDFIVADYPKHVVKVDSIGAGCKMYDTLIHSIGLHINGEECDASLTVWEDGRMHLDGVIQSKYL